MKHLNTTRACQSLKNLIAVGAFAVAGILASGGIAHASDADAQALKQARDRMLVGAALLDKEDMSYDGVTPFSMAFIDRGNYSSIKTPLKAGVAYAILGVGDDDVTDVDVIVQDSAGNLIAQDVEDSASALAVFRPRYGGNYTIFLKLHSGHTYTSACALSIFRGSGGYTLSNDLVRKTTDNMIDTCQQLHDRFNTTYHSGTGQWAIVGSILEPGASSTFSGISTLEGLYAFVAIGDEYTSNVNMKVRDYNNTVLLTDEDDDESAVCSTTFNSRQTCSIEITNAKADEFSLVLHSVLHQ